MRFSPLPYLSWVLLPVAVMGILGQRAAQKEAESHVRTNTSRMGELARTLFAQEMGQKAAELVEEAPLLTNPDPDSPLLQAAQQGDTVAALGISSGTLTLSVALAEGPPDSTTIRATTAAFPTRTPTLVASRTGFSVALYLRGRRALTTSQDFGPEAMANPDAPPFPAPSVIPEGSAFFPLATSTQGGVSPAQLLVGPPSLPDDEGSRWMVLVGILVAVGLGVAAGHSTPSGEAEDRPRSPLRPLLLAGIPMVLLWVSLLGTGFRIGAEAEDSLREDLVRTLALLKEGEPPLSPEALLESTGFYLLRQEAGSVIEANIPEGPIREGLMALPLPPPTFPSLGPLQGVDQEGVYAHLRVGSQGSITLLAPAIRVPQRRFMLLMGGLGGIASLLCLGYLLPFRRGTGR